MSIIKWSEEFSVGVKEMDKQHKKIIKILNEVYSLNEKGVNEKDVEKIFSDLQNYIKEHFRSEEEYMIKRQYSGYDEHKQEHNLFIDRFYEFQKEYLKGYRLTTINLFNFVWDWFSRHILKVDKQYSPL